MENINLIKASAGSGKTHRLMELLSEKLSAGVSPEGLLATTFTVKAAAELQSRIRQELLKGSSPEMASRVFDGLIGTVNGVCGQLLSEYSIESGLSPALDVLPEDNADTIFAAATHSVIEKYKDKLEEIASRLELNPLKENFYGQTPDWRKDVRKIVNLARSNAIDQAGLQACAEKSCAALKKVFPANEDLSLKNIADMIAPYKDFNAQGSSTAASVNAINNFLRFPSWGKAAGFANCKCAVTKDGDFPIDMLHEIGESVIYSKELFADLSAMIRRVFGCAADALEAYAEYKKAFGLVDFVDQESRVLDLLNNNESFQKLMAQRINQIMVDEFQDTSPIQLSLFLKLNTYSQNGSVWVGDPKQAIYGFRGTDPELMEAVTASVPSFETLPNSWRSKENLVNFSNEIFKRAFADTPENEVVLGIPPERKETAKGGELEAWHIIGSNANDRMAALAQGIAGLIRDEGVSPGDIGVLFWSNLECASLANALAKWNISASAPAGNLLEQTECQLVMAAYRYCIDHSDTAALATLTALYGEEPDWLNKFCKAKQEQLSLPDAEQKTCDPFAAIKAAEWLKKLVKPVDSTPLEILEHVISVLELDKKIAAMNNPDLRMSNLDELRKVCNEYMSQALVNRTAATPAGFVAMLANDEKKSASGFGENTVNIMTYHKSKGLEFPVVILGSLDSEGKSNAFDIRTVGAEKFDINDPLANRTIHYWPWPFGNLKNVAGLDAILANNPLQQYVKEREIEEGKRLFYVGLTRARDHIIFAMEKKTPKKGDAYLAINWLDSLTNENIFHFPMPDKDSSGKIEIGVKEDKNNITGESTASKNKEFEIKTKILIASENIVPLPTPAVYADEMIFNEGKPARKSPSSEKADGVASLLTQWDYFTGKIKCEKGKFNQLGSAFHDYIALNPQKDGKLYAQRLLKNYGVENSVEPEVLVECCQNLYNWLNSAYPGAKISCEVPITYHNADGTLYQGFIDMLLELPEGFVIIDHKTHPAAHDAEKYAASCAGQLDLYRQAVEAAADKKVLQTIIHLPNLGRCYEVKINETK